MKSRTSRPQRQKSNLKSDSALHRACITNRLSWAAGLLYLLHDICSHDFRQIWAIPGSVDLQNPAYKTTL
jgi:hypothetical protein